MKRVLGVLMLIGGVAFGVYVGVWLCFIGGIVDIVNELKGDHPVEAINLAWGIFKIMFASAIGGISALLLVIPGFAMAQSDDE